MKRSLMFLLMVVVVAVGGIAKGQQPKKMARIGYLSSLSGPPPTLVAFKEGLRELGWVEEKQIEFEYRYAGGNPDKLSEFATELVRLKVDVIVAGPANVAPNAAKHATTTIPQADKLASGLAALEEIPASRVANYQPFWAARGHLLQLLNRKDESLKAFTRAASLTDDPALREYLFRRSAEDS